MGKRNPPAPVSAEALTQGLKEFLHARNYSFSLSPPLPASWPSAGIVEFYSYSSVPLPTGIIAYQISGPECRITVNLSGGEPHIDTLGETTVQGRESGIRGMKNSAAWKQAEQALVDVVAGLRKPDDARTDLHAYLEWAASEKPIGPDIRKRKATFFAWLETGSKP